MKGGRWREGRGAGREGLPEVSMAVSHVSSSPPTASCLRAREGGGEEGRKGDRNT